MPSILALDLGTNTGWATQQSGGGLITSGVQTFKPSRFEGGGMRFLRMRVWLTELEEACGGIRAIWFEEVRRHRGTDAAHIYGGLFGILSEWAENRKIPYAGVPVGTIKKHATGNGSASKGAMIEAARRLGHAPADDNEADALCLLDWVRATQREAA